MKRILLGWDPMCDESVRYARDLECRVARIACGGTCTTNQIAKPWNLSKQRVSQLELRAIAKIRRLAASGNRDALDMLAAIAHQRPETLWEQLENMRPYKQGEVHAEESVMTGPRTQRLVLPYAAPNLNDLIRATNDASTRRGIVRYQTKVKRRRKPLPVRDAYLEAKSQWAVRVLAHVREQHINPFPRGAHITFRIVEVDRRRDPDNLASGAAKFILDGLVKAGVIPNDGWTHVLSLAFEFSVNPNKGCVEVMLQEEP